MPGHEFAGEVVAIGKDVRSWQVGDRVTVPFSMGCGSCRECQSGNQQICDRYAQPGFTQWGAFVEYVALPYADVNLVRVPESLSYVDVASLGCRFVTAFRAVMAQAKVQAGEWVAVHGCGGVGLSAIMIAVAAGAQAIAVDINPETLKLAETVGAVHTLNASTMTSSELVAAIHDLTDGGVHVSLDALGNTVTCQNSILSLRKRGRHVQVGLLVGDYASPTLPMGAVISKELEIYGSHGMQAHVYPSLLNLIEHGKLNPSQLIHKRVSLEESAHVLEQMTTYGTLGISVIDRF